MVILSGFAKPIHIAAISHVRRGVHQCTHHGEESHVICTARLFASVGCSCELLDWPTQGDTLE